MKLDIYDSKRKKQVLSRLNDFYGFNEVNGFFFETGKEKIRLFTGNLTIDELYDIGDCGRVEYMGIYLFKDEGKYLRIGFDACNLFREKIVRGIIQINEAELKLWMNGENLNKKVENGMYIIQSGQDCFGCAVSDGEKLINYVPKDRRIRRS